MKCIYCLEEKPETSFTKAEHVIPQSFGVFEENFTLNQPHNKSVCDDCNQYFGDNLEINLGRDTVEGISRYDYGIKKPEEFKSVGKRSRIQHKKIAEGILKGTYFYLAYSEKANLIVPMPLPQVGFQSKVSSEYTYFLLDDIPEKTELANQGLNCVTNVRAFGENFEEILRALTQKGYSVEFQEELPWTDDQPDTLLVEYQTSVDSVILRAIAKIAFNYLAYLQGHEFVLQDIFNPIRSYIRDGKLRNPPFVKFQDKNILQDEPAEGLRRIIHIVTLDWALDGSSLISKVSLLNLLSYTVQLATNYPSPRPNLRKGHYFNIADHKIYELTAR